MKRLLMTPGIAIAAALALSACGGGGSSGTSGNNASGAAGSGAAGSDPVSVRQLSGVGSVLVDPSGKALYSPEQEASGKIICTGGCNAFWKPVVAGAAAPKSASGTGTLGVIKRPDGGVQLTANGKPLYTFVEDSPGNATGNGFTDDFGGHHFIWHVVRAGGTTATVAAGGGGTNAPSTTGSSSGGLGY